VPLYVYRCPNDHNFERVLKVADYDSLQYCDCGQKAKRQVTSAMLAPMFEDYQSPIDGSPISSKRKRKEEMARNDCVEYDPCLKDESTQKMKAGEAALEKEIDNTVDKYWDGLSLQQREGFAQEVVGTDLNYSRE